MNVVFRVDANAEIGLGHLSRCILLAKALIKDGSQVSFLVNSSPLINVAELTSLGITVAYLSELIADDEKTFSQLDWDRAQTVLSALENLDWIIVDHKHLQATWQKQASAFCKRIMVIDDAETQQHYCDVLVNYNPRLSYSTASRYQELLLPNKSHKVTLLLGPKYALLNETFFKSTPRMKPEKVRVGLFFGSFPAQLILPLLQPLIAQMPKLEDVSFHLVHPDLAAFAVVTQFDNVSADGFYPMTDFLNEVDMVIGTTGVAALERVANGMPAINLLLAGHAHLGVKALAQQGCCCLVKADATAGSDLYSIFMALLDNKHYQEQSNACIQFSKTMQGAPAIIKVMKENQY